VGRVPTPVTDGNLLLLLLGCRFDEAHLNTAKLLFSSSRLGRKHLQFYADETGLMR
jgi:hypothetical protein